jgi:hypothetical protein
MTTTSDEGMPSSNGTGPHSEAAAPHTHYNGTQNATSRSRGTAYHPSPESVEAAKSADGRETTTSARQTAAVVAGYASGEQAIIDCVNRRYLIQLGHLHAARGLLAVHGKLVSTLWEPLLKKELAHQNGLTPAYPALSLRFKAFAYVFLFAGDLLTLHAIFARLDFGGADSWTMIFAITGVLVALPSFSSYSLLSLHNGDVEALTAARRSLTRILGVVTAVSLVLIAVGVGGLAAIAVNDQVDAPQLLSVFMTAVFMGAATGLPAVSGCMASYSYVPGASAWARSKAAVTVSSGLVTGGRVVQRARRAEDSLSARLQARHARTEQRVQIARSLAVKDALTEATKAGQDPANFIGRAAAAYPVSVPSSGLERLDGLLRRDPGGTQPEEGQA